MNLYSRERDLTWGGNRHRSQEVKGKGGVGGDGEKKTGTGLCIFLYSWKEKGLSLKSNLAEQREGSPIRG